MILFAYIHYQMIQTFMRLNLSILEINAKNLANIFRNLSLIP